MRVRSVTRRAFDGPSPLAADPEHRARYATYLADLLRPYGMTARDDLTGQSYGEMAAAVLPPEPVDLLVLAFAGPDIVPGRATATWLGSLCTGDPLAFAVCDQGSAAPFTALRILRDYGRTAVLLVVEQADLPYPAPVPAGHTAVAVRLDPGGVADLRQYADVDPTDVPGLLGGDLIVSASVAAPAGARVADPGRPVTGVWWELADTTHAGQVTLADYDPRLRRLCVATIDMATAETATGASVPPVSQVVGP